MAVNILYYQNLIVSGLGTTTFILPTPGIYTLAWTTSLPMASQDGGLSLVTATIKQNTLRIFNGPPGGTGSRVLILANAGDQIDCTLSSTSAVDKVLNAIKTTYTFVQRGITTNLGGGSLTFDQLAMWG